MKQESPKQSFGSRVKYHVKRFGKAYEAVSDFTKKNIPRVKNFAEGYSVGGPLGGIANVVANDFIGGENVAQDVKELKSSLKRAFGKRERLEDVVARDYYHGNPPWRHRDREYRADTIDPGRRRLAPDAIYPDETTARAYGLID